MPGKQLRGRYRHVTSPRFNPSRQLSAPSHSLCLCCPGVEHRVARAGAIAASLLQPGGATLAMAPRSARPGRGSGGVGGAGGTTVRQGSSGLQVLAGACGALRKSFKLISTKCSFGFDFECEQWEDTRNLSLVGRSTLVCL